MAGALEVELGAVETAMGIRLPVELRDSLLASNGSGEWFGEVFVELFDTKTLVAVNTEIEHHPGFLAFASDGSRELLGLDLRRQPPPVVMIDVTSPGWEEARWQAATYGEFMEQRRHHAPLRWDVRHS